MLQPDKFSLSTTQDVTVGTTRRFVLSQPLTEAPQYLWIGPKTEIMVYLDQGKPRAFHSICPHMGARLEKCPDTGKIKCPWHGLEYSAETLSSTHHRYKKLCEIKVELQDHTIILVGKSEPQEAVNEN